MEIRAGLDGYEPAFFLPQWIAFPDFPPFSMGWRMGAGEDYLMDLWAWRKKQSPEALQEYDAYFAPPEEWVKARIIRERLFERHQHKPK